MEVKGQYPFLDKIPFFPIIKNFKANTAFKAFILAALFQTILLSFTFASKDYFEKNIKNAYLKWFVSVLYIFIITFISYTVMYLLFGFGGGMLTNS